MLNNTKNEFDYDILWTVKEVAQYLKVSKGHVYNLSSRGEIPLRKRDGLLRFRPDEIAEWVEEGYIHYKKAKQSRVK